VSSNADLLIAPQASAVKSNLTCFTAMVMWAFAFPIAEFMLQSWGAISLVLARQLIGVSVLFSIWLWFDGWSTVYRANWRRGIGVGGAVLRYGDRGSFSR
jgi:hypothetical protein